MQTLLTIDSLTGRRKRSAILVGDVVTVDVNGKIPTSVLPALATTETFVVATQAAMLALVAQPGDIAVRTDLSRSFILSGADPTILGNWVELLTPVDSVLSVNGLTGTVSLTTTNIPEGTNKYFTDARVTASPTVAQHTTDIAELQADLAAGASSGFSCGRSGAAGAGTYLTHESVPTNITGILAPITGIIEKISVVCEDADTFSIVLERRVGASFTTLTTVNLTSSRKATFSPSNVSVTADDEIAVRLGSGAAKNLKVTFILKGSL